MVFRDRFLYGASLASDNRRHCRPLAQSHHGARTATSEENDYETRDSQPFGHDFDRHHRRCCAGRRRDWSSAFPDRHRTNDTCANDIPDAAAANSVQADISVSDEIAAPRLRCVLTAGGAIRS